MSQPVKDIILIIEDENLISDILSEIVEMLGFETYRCSNGREALDLLLDKKIEPVLVICDVNMPEMSGIEFIKFQLAKNLNLNICMLTGDSSSEVILQALKLGATDYITKPFNLPELSEKIITLAEIGKNKLKIKALLNKNPELNQINKNENLLRVINSGKQNNDDDDNS